MEVGSRVAMASGIREWWPCAQLISCTPQGRTRHVAARGCNSTQATRTWRRPRLRRELPRHRHCARSAASHCFQASQEKNAGPAQQLLLLTAVSSCASAAASYCVLFVLVSGLWLIFVHKHRTYHISSWPCAIYALCSIPYTGGNHNNCALHSQL